MYEVLTVDGSRWKVEKLNFDATAVEGTRTISVEPSQFFPWPNTWEETFLVATDKIVAWRELKDEITSH